MVGPGGATLASRTFGLEEITELSDPGDHPEYSIRKVSDPEPSQPGIPGSVTSLRTLVSAVPTPGGGSTVDPDTVTFTEVVEPSGTSHPLRRGDLKDKTAPDFPFMQGLMPAVYQEGAAQLGYIRPLRDSSDYNISGNPNYGGFFQISGGTIHVIAHTQGALLTPVLSFEKVPKGPAVPRRTVDFAVAPAPAGATYTWSFGDGRPPLTGAVPSVRHTFGDDADSYAVTVAVEVPADGSSGLSDPVTVVFGPPPEPGDDDHDGNGNGHEDDDADTGGGQGSGHHEGGDANDHPDGPAGDGETPSSSATGAAAPDQTPAQPQHHVAAGAGTVTGQLLLASAEVVPAEGAPVTAAPAHAPRAPAPFGIPGWVVVPVVVWLMLALGVLSEVRSVRGKMRT